LSKHEIETMAKAFERVLDNLRREKVPILEDASDGADDHLCQ